MLRCPNCNQKVDTNTCKCCGYPILEGWEARRRKANKKAKKEATLAAKETAKREAEAAKQAREAEEKAKKEATLAAKETAKREAETAKQAREAEVKAKKETPVDIHQGNLRLVFQNSLSLKQLKLFLNSLQQVENLKVNSVGGSDKEGVLIGVSVLKPMPLSYVFDRTHMVDKFEQNQNNVKLVLNTVFN